jgi:hypothetical protein
MIVSSPVIQWFREEEEKKKKRGPSEEMKINEQIIGLHL